MDGGEAVENDTFHDLVRLHGEATTPVSARRVRRRFLWMVLAAIASALAGYLRQ